MAALPRYAPTAPVVARRTAPRADHQPRSAPAQEIAPAPTSLAVAGFAPIEEDNVFEGDAIDIWGHVPDLGAADHEEF